MEDTKIQPTPVKIKEKPTTPNWKGGWGKRKQKQDLFAKTQRRVRMKTPFGPSLKAFGAFFNDKAKDWEQLDWDKFDLSAFAAMELEDVAQRAATDRQIGARSRA